MRMDDLSAKAIYSSTLMGKGPEVYIGPAASGGYELARASPHTQSMKAVKRVVLLQPASLIT